jgi:hypothetical protein
MQCERCKDEILKGEERDLHGRIVCEDCYMDLLSPAKACDPWAVHSAKTFLKDSSHSLELSPAQQKILEVLKKKGPTEPRELTRILKIKETDLEREFAALRHMEKIRGELRDGKKLVRLW